MQKSLAYTLREVLDELPFGPGPEYEMAINEHFRHSLVDACALFVNARKEALAAVYRNKVPTKTGSVEVAADFEEVAASCGYFSSSLQDFAEDMVTFLDILEELKAKRHTRHRSWDWLKFWRNWGRSKKRPDSGEIYCVGFVGALADTQQHKAVFWTTQLSAASPKRFTTRCIVSQIPRNRRPKNP